MLSPSSRLTGRSRACHRRHRVVAALARNQGEREHGKADSVPDVRLTSGMVRGQSVTMKTALGFAVVLGVVGCGDGDPSGGPDSGSAGDAAPDGTPACGAGITPEPGLVVTAAGAVRGAAVGATYAFLGIPFAEPPVAELRFRPPVVHACWQGERPATAFGSVCPQIDMGAVIGDEDCLTLNVWTPATPPATPLPVMVWLHGGGEVAGSGSEPFYDGQDLAETYGVVVVTLNYRLGQLGFLAHTALTSESPAGVSGNYGMLDQIAALDWVQRNAAVFGGDAGNVMIFGESAGGRNVCTLVASPLAAGLFHRAAMQSGACAFLDTLAETETFGATYADMAGCTGAADVPDCLRALDVDTVVNTLSSPPSSLGGSNWGANVDGHVLPALPLDALAAGTHNHVPLVIGTNADETARDAPMIATDAGYQQAVRAVYGMVFGDLIMAQYPSASFPTPRHAFIAVTSDSRFTCPARQIARAAVAGQSEPVYRYFFTYSPGPLGAVHGIEIPYLFHTMDRVPRFTPGAADERVSATVGTAWTSFAATGDPGTVAAPWPVYLTDGSDRHIVLDDPPSTGDGIHTNRCDFWDMLL